MKKILAELDHPESEHVDPWLTHESGWTLAVNVHGDVVWSNEVEQFVARHQTSVSREAMLRLWCALAAGELEALEREAWQFGTPAAREPRRVPRKDRALRALSISFAISALSWMSAVMALLFAFSSFAKPGSARDISIVLANIWLPPLCVSLLLTAIVQGNIDRRWRDRDRRIARACRVLAVVLLLPLILAAFGCFVYAFEPRDLTETSPEVWLGGTLILLIAGLGLVSPPLIVAVLAAERAKREDRR